MSQDDSPDDGDETDGLLDTDGLADLRAFPWPVGVVAGGAAWLAGYVLFAALFYLGPASIGASSQSERLTQIGHLFYNAQFVDRVVAAPSDVLIPGGRRTNFLLEAAATQLPLPAYFAPPIVALVVVGAVIGWRAFGSEATAVEGGLTGFAMALGYLALAVVGTFLFVVEAAEGQVTATPDRLQTLAFGFAYPFVLGTLGAVIGIYTDR